MPAQHRGVERSTSRCIISRSVRRAVNEELVLTSRFEFGLIWRERLPRRMMRCMAYAPPTPWTCGPACWCCCHNHRARKELCRHLIVLNGEDTPPWSSTYALRKNWWRQGLDPTKQGRTCSTATMSKPADGQAATAVRRPA